MDSLDLIKNYIDILESKLGLDIIVYDECNLFSQTRLKSVSHIGKWHINPYCLKIKDNKALRRRCVHLKKDFVAKVLLSEGVVSSTCYAGVTEYVMPIKCGGRLIAMVAAVGFRGELKDSTYRILAGRVGMKYKSFMSLRRDALSDVSDETSIKNSVEILAHLLTRYITEETDIPSIIESKRRESNAHVIKATEYIARSFSLPITAKDVAEHCHVSESHLKHLFSSSLGHGIAEELRRCRLEYARELLCTTDYSVKYISYLSGFISKDYFSTVFKKHFMTSPLRYRSQNRIRTLKG